MKYARAEEGERPPALRVRTATGTTASTRDSLPRVRWPSGLRTGIPTGAVRSIGAGIRPEPSSTRRARHLGTGDEHVRSVALGFWIGAGARDEPPARAGVTHFLEHLLLGAGSRSYNGPPDRGGIFDGLGGELNAATAREYTVVYARVLDEHLRGRARGDDRHGLLGRVRRPRSRGRSRHRGDRDGRGHAAELVLPSSRRRSSAIIRSGAVLGAGRSDRVGVAPRDLGLSPLAPTGPTTSSWPRPGTSRKHDGSSA